MSRPALVPHHLKSLFHNKRSCIDVRNGHMYAIKANTNNRSWHNVVTKDKAAIAINVRTRDDNNAVFESTEPFHVLTFGCGADTYYWGRYSFVRKKTYGGQACFELKFADNGALGQCLSPNQAQTRSRLEDKWIKAFKGSDTAHTYEPATLKLPSSKLLPDKEYTPDIWFPETREFIEIKGPEPSAKEFEKCRLTTQLGFQIKLFRGGPDGFDCYEWSEDGKRSHKHYASWYRYLHPRNERKRRKLHNIKSI